MVETSLLYMILIAWMWGNPSASHLHLCDEEIEKVDLKNGLKGVLILISSELQYLFVLFFTQLLKHDSKNHINCYVAGLIYFATLQISYDINI